MKFGLHFQLPCSGNQNPIQRYQETLAQAAHAETLGFESVWPVEQHFNADFSILPSPLLLLAALAERTRTIRLGIGIVLLPLTQPVRVAEEIATLDILSHGRVEFGVGRGVFPSHFAGFGIPQSESRDRLSESLDLIRQAWTQERVTFHGRFFTVDNLSIVPKPVQQPHPPIRVAANTSETFELMGRLGYPILVASQVNTFPKLRELVPFYHQARREADHSLANGEEISLLSPLYVAPTSAQVQQEVGPSIAHFLHTLSSSFSGGNTPTTPLLQEAAERMRRITYEQVCETMATFATPEACIERLRWVQQEFNPGRVICWFNPGGLVPHTHVLRSMELFAAKVMPHFV